MEVTDETVIRWIEELQVGVGQGIYPYHVACMASEQFEIPLARAMILTHLGLWPAPAHSPPAQSLAA
jgi:hypothetical protein